MKVLIPIKNVDGIGIREVISEEDADKVFLILKNKALPSIQTGTSDTGKT